MYYSVVIASNNSGVRDSQQITVADLSTAHCDSSGIY